MCFTKYFAPGLSCSTCSSSMFHHWGPPHSLRTADLAEDDHMCCRRLTDSCSCCLYDGMYSSMFDLSAVLIHQVLCCAAFPRIFYSTTCHVTSSVRTRWAQPPSPRAGRYFLFKNLPPGSFSQTAAGSFVLLPLVLFACKRRSEAILFFGWNSERCRAVFFVYCFVVWLLLFVLCGFRRCYLLPCRAYKCEEGADKCSDFGEKKKKKRPAQFL